VSGPGTSSASFIFEGLNNGQYIGVSYSYMELAADTRTSLAEKKEQLRRELDQIDHKLSFLAETGKEEVDDKTFRFYNVMKTLEKDMTTLEKAEALAGIMD
jgi:hypothetical protein